MCELAGTFSIFLYIRAVQVAWKEEVDRQQYIEPPLHGVSSHHHIPNVTIQPPAFEYVLLWPDCDNTVIMTAGYCAFIIRSMPVGPPIFCRKHGRRRHSRARDFMPSSRETSPIPMIGFAEAHHLHPQVHKSPRNSLTVPNSDSDEPSLPPPPPVGRGLRLSESMRDLTYFTLPIDEERGIEYMPSITSDSETNYRLDACAGHFSRDTTCHTMSTSADIYSREVSRDSFRLPFRPQRSLDDGRAIVSRAALQSTFVADPFPPPPPPPPPMSCPPPPHLGSLHDMYEFDDDISDEPRREYSFETLRRTTPV